ncbi:DoxX family protein [Marinifilum fragile]
MIMNIEFKELDLKIARHMQKLSIPAIRISFAVIFVWFGILKPIGLSAAIPLVKSTVSWMPLFDAETWVDIIGWWEVLIGVFFLFKRSTRIAIGLLFLQMTGTFMPLFMLPEVTFQGGNILLPTLEGQYVIKNIMIISAALTIGGSLIYSKK